MASLSPKQLNDSLFSLYEPEDSNAEFLFFHGADYEACDDMHIRAWMSSGVCWPAAWLQEEPGFPRARILSIQYDSSLKKAHDAGRYSMRLLAEALAMDLILLSDVGQRGRPVVLIGHELGGLVIKGLCVYLQNHTRLYNGSRREELLGLQEKSRIRRYELFLKNVKGIFYFSTPHQGLEFVNDSSTFNGELVPRLTVFNAETAQLNDDFEKLRRSREWKTAGVGSLIADPKSSVKIREASMRNATDQFIMVMDSVQSICKPASRLSSTFQFFVASTTTFVRLELKEEPDLEFEEHMKEYVGLEGAVEEVLSIFSHLQKAEGGTSAVVLHGMGGIGKSTLGRALFFKLSKNFDPDCRCSVDRDAVFNIQTSISALQRSILDNLGWDSRSSSAADRQQNRRKLKECYRNFDRPLLLFIDNIEDPLEMEDIFPKPFDEFLPKGSQIIVATRNFQVFKVLQTTGVRKVCSYDVKELDEISAQKLFCQYALGSREPKEALKEVWKDVRKVLKACSGLPLALKIVGAALMPEVETFSSSRWNVDPVLERLRNWLAVDGGKEDTLQRSLEFSYNELGQESQDAFLDTVFCFQGSPWDELQVLYPDKLEILKRRALIMKESHTERGQSLSFPTVKVHSCLVSLGMRKGRDLGTHIDVRWDTGEDDGIDDIVFSAEKVRSVVLVLRGDVPSFPSLYMETLFYRLSSAEETPALPVRKLKRFAPKLRILILRDLRIGGTFVTADLPKNLQCFICVNSSVPFARGDLTSFKKLIHVDIATAIDKNDSYTFPSGLQKLRLEAPHMKFFGFGPPGKELKLRELGLMSASGFQAQNHVSQFHALKKLALQDINGLNNNLLAEIFKIKSLRSLSIQHCSHISVLPEFMIMEHLEHLHLALPDLVRIPDSLHNLDNLRSLKLENCFLLKQLPSGVGTHSNLKLDFIIIKQCHELKALPPSFEDMETMTSTQVQRLEDLGLISPSAFKWHVFRRAHSRVKEIHEAAATTQMPPLITQIRRLTPSVYELLPEPNPDVEVVFFHGLPIRGTDPREAWWTTWKMRHSDECWPISLLPELLQKDGTQYKTRVLSVSYEGVTVSDKGMFGGNEDHLADGLSLIQELILGRGNLGQKDGVPVFLVGHDLGGILIKHLVMSVVKAECSVSDGSFTEPRQKLTKFLTNLKSVFFFAMPYGPRSDAIQYFTSETDTDNHMYRLMTELDGNLLRINHEFQEYRRAQSPYSKITAYAVHPPTYIKNEFLGDPGPNGHVLMDVDGFHTESGDHFTICQPEGRKSMSVKILSDQIIREVISLREGSSEASRQIRSRVQGNVEHSDSGSIPSWWSSAKGSAVPLLVFHSVTHG